MLFSEAKPSSVSALVGNPSAFARAKEWAKEWAQGRPQKPLLVCGPTGIGKTALAHALACEFSFELFEFNASDLRNEDAVSRLLSNAVQSNSLFGTMRLVLIDDVDSLSGREDRGGMGAISKVLQSARAPIILTAHNLWAREISAARAHCEPLELRKVQAGTIASLLKKLAPHCAVPPSPESIEKIAQGAGGDVRAALNDLQGGNQLSIRDTEKGIFETVRTIFKSEKYAESRAAAFSSDTERDMLKWWVSSNLPAEYERPFDLAEGYNSLSRADVFDGRIIRTQYWGFLRYVTDHVSAGVSTAKTAPYHKFSMISFPSYIRQMGSSKGGRAGRKKILSKVARSCHCSVSAAQYYFPIIRSAAKDSPQSLSTEYGLDEEDADFLLGKATKSVASAKKKSAIEAVEESKDDEKTPKQKKPRSAKKKQI